MTNAKAAADARAPYAKKILELEAQNKKLLDGYHYIARLIKDGEIVDGVEFEPTFEDTWSALNDVIDMARALSANTRPSDTLLLTQLARDVFDTFKFEFRNDRPINGPQAVDALAALRIQALAALVT